MSLRRRRKADRIKPSDFGLEELSKINKEDTVRVMDLFTGKNRRKAVR